MFGRKKEAQYRFALDIEKVREYFKSNNYIGMNYKGSKTGNDKLSKEISRYQEHMEWIKGYESFGTNYVVYHGDSIHWTGLLFNKLKELAESTAKKSGFYSQANKEIENYVIRDQEDMTFYMLRVGSDIITTCVAREQEEEMKKVFQTLNTFVYKRAV